MWLASAHAENSPNKSDVFVSGTDAYHTYRIPSIVATKSGALVAFCEGRKSSRADTGDVDVLCKRSTDGGKSWSRQKILWDDGTNTCGNPCAVVDENTGKVWLLLTHNLGGDKESALSSHAARGARTVWLCHSDDEGVTWSEPKEITGDVKDPS